MVMLSPPIQALKKDGKGAKNPFIFLMYNQMKISFS